MSKLLHTPRMCHTIEPTCGGLLASLREGNRLSKQTPTRNLGCSNETERTSTRCASINDDRSECSVDYTDSVSGFNVRYNRAPFEQNANNKNFQQSHKYKTEMCKNFELHGYCKWADGCCFAHGRAELRTKTLFNYFYKTKVCKHFHKNGFCPYGTRCQYFHFKPYQVYTELLDSTEKKLLIRMAEDGSLSLGAMLDKNERSLGRLAVFARLYGAEPKKSLYERYLDDCY